MTTTDSFLTIVIPAYNEAESLPKLLEDLLPFAKGNNWKIIIINDGSKDKTKEVLNNEQHDSLKIIHHKVNKGYGGAIKSGIKEVDTKYLVTIDADGQHNLSDLEMMFKITQEKDADLVIGNRKGNKTSGLYREFGKTIIRLIAKIMMPLPIYDINSGLKMYDTKLAQKYIHLCPDTMAYSDIITLIFIYQRNLVLEVPVKINNRIAGESTIGIRTAIDTVLEIINIVMLFNPMRIFFTLSVISILSAFIWEIPIYLRGDGISIGALLGFITGFLFILLGLITEQLGHIRKFIIKDLDS